MLNLKAQIDLIEKYLQVGTTAALTYAALECRLAIECIAYERLRLAHDYISNADLRKWQPGGIVKALLREVDGNIAQSFTLSVSESPLDADDVALNPDDFEKLKFIPVGFQVGLDPRKLESLWNALSNVALHIRIPAAKEDPVSRYGNAAAIREKVEDAIAELKRIGEGTMISTGLGAEISFNCKCGSLNKRRQALLTDKQVVSCVRFGCRESYWFHKAESSFERRTVDIECKSCGVNRAGFAGG